MSLPDHVWFWWTEMIIAIIGVPFLILICTVHFCYVIVDLCTKRKKKSVAYKSSPKLYAFMISLSMASIALLTFSNILDIVWMWNYKFLSKSKLKSMMEWDIKTGTISWFIAKQSMYILFLVRLHIAYKSSMYSYNIKYLILIATISGIAMLVNIINVLIYTTVKAFYYEQYHFAVHFNSYYPLWVVLMSGFPDIVISMIFIYLFTKPLKIIINNIDKTAETKDGILELYNTGIKALILTSTSTLTTLIFLLFVLFTKTLVILPIDSIINCLCMMMITPYYPDIKYYHKLCILPIKCSERCTNSLRELQAIDDESRAQNTTMTMQGPVQVQISVSRTHTQLTNASRI